MVIICSNLESCLQPQANANMSSQQANIFLGELLLIHAS
jgi:hypothetical protein